MTTRRFSRPSAALTGAALFCAALAGCTAGPPAPEDGGPPRMETAAPATPAPAETAAVTPPTEPVIDADPKQLDGLDQAGLTRLLGAPAFRRVDDPATLLRWRNDACVLDAFLYVPRGRSGAPATLDHAEARTTRNGDITLRDCLHALLRARAMGKG